MIRKITLWTCAALFVVGAGILSSETASAAWGRDAGFWNNGYPSRHYAGSCSPYSQFRDNVSRSRSPWGSNYRGGFDFGGNRFDSYNPTFDRQDWRGYDSFDRFDWNGRGHDYRH